MNHLTSKVKNNFDDEWLEQMLDDWHYVCWARGKDRHHRWIYQDRIAGDKLVAVSSGPFDRNWIDEFDQSFIGYDNDV